MCDEKQIYECYYITAYNDKYFMVVNCGETCGSEEKEIPKYLYDALLKFYQDEYYKNEFYKYLESLGSYTHNKYIKFKNSHKETK